MTEGSCRAKTILVVEDEMDMRFFMSTLVKTMGHLPILSKNGKEALAKIRETTPDLIIMDLMMPGEGGSLMYRKLKSDSATCEIPVIVLSAVAKNVFFHYLNMLDTRLEEAVPRPDAYVEKPPEPDDLMAEINKLLE